MPLSPNTPFRIFANSNLGSEFDFTHLTGEWTNAKSTGHAHVFPHVNLATGNLGISSAMIKTQEQIGNCEFGFVYNNQSQTLWTANTPSISASANNSTLTICEKDGSFVNYISQGDNTYTAPAGGKSKPVIKKQQDGSYVLTNPANNEQRIFDENGKWLYNFKTNLVAKFTIIRNNRLYYCPLILIPGAQPEISVYKITYNFTK